MDQTESANTLDGAAPAAEVSAIVTARIGRYPILRKLGEGGMGVVYAAYDDLLDRKLAIKLLRPRSRDAPQTRLWREAQGLARLSHSNVVQIYEIGQHGDAVFMAMEFVEGQTLGAWLRQQRRSRAQILEAFTAAGRGLAAAHAARLIHRDFKPDNVMIAKDGDVKVMDFGLVRAEGSSDPELDELTRSGTRATLDEAELGSSVSHGSLDVELTKTGSILGTPAYMAPEQHMGQPTDARCDQFSFCVALWEALYGARPFAGESIAALTFNVMQGKITEPARDADVPGWLRKVIERGLALDPADRWPSMEALIDALGRDPTRRRRTLLAAIGVALLAVGAWSWQQAEQERQAEAQRTAREHALAQCDARAQSIDEVWNLATRDRIERAFGSSKLAFANEAWTRTRMALDDYATAWTDTQKRVCVESEIDQTLAPTTAALAYACLDERKAALASLTTLLGEADDARILRSVSSAAELPLPSACSSANELARAQPLPDDPELHARADALRQRLARIDALETMGEYEAGAREAEIARTEAESLAWPPLLAAAHHALGQLASSSGDYAAARTAYEQAMIVAARAGHDELAVEASISLIYAVGVGLDNPDDGLRIAKLAEIMLARLEQHDPLIEAKLRNNIGAIHERRGELDQALAEFERALTIYQAVLPQAHPSISIALNNIGTIHGRQGRLDQALAYFERTLKIREASLPPGHPRFAAAHENIGNVHAHAGANELAIAAFERALAINEANLPPDHLDIANNLSNLGAVHLDLEDFAAAEPLFRRVLAIRAAALPPESRLVGAAHHGLGLALSGRRQHDEGIDHLRRALAIYEAALEPTDPRVIELREDLEGAIAAAN